MDNMNIRQSVGVEVVRKAYIVRCSKCNELRKQETRCENCGYLVPLHEEKVVNVEN